MFRSPGKTRSWGGGDKTSGPKVGPRIERLRNGFFSGHERPHEPLRAAAACERLLAAEPGCGQPEGRSPAWGGGDAGTGGGGCPDVRTPDNSATLTEVVAPAGARACEPGRTSVRGPHVPSRVRGNTHTALRRAGECHAQGDKPPAPGIPAQGRRRRRMEEEEEEEQEEEEEEEEEQEEQEEEEEEEQDEEEEEESQGCTRCPYLPPQLHQVCGVELIRGRGLVANPPGPRGPGGAEPRP
ncbi:unnamed protein product [Boreogadus saida]